eukprot:2891217-Pleurochrysis_carterae.AAC.1
MGAGERSCLPPLFARFVVSRCRRGGDVEHAQVRQPRAADSEQAARDDRPHAGADRRADRAGEAAAAAFRM